MGLVSKNLLGAHSDITGKGVRVASCSPAQELSVASRVLEEQWPRSGVHLKAFWAMVSIPAPRHIRRIPGSMCDKECRGLRS